VIERIRHKGLARFFEVGDVRGINAQHADRLRLLLTALNIATSPNGMNLPGAKLHPLKGELKGYWAVSVSGNWRLIFQFDGPNATNVDLIDYH
jgi:proteic killer suppression protein